MNLVRAHGYAGELGRLGVQADVVDTPAERGEVQQPGEHDREHDEDDHDQRDAGAADLLLGQVAPLARGSR